MHGSPDIVWKNIAKMRMQKKIQIHPLDEDDAPKDLLYWLSKSPMERVEAVEQLRKMQYGDTERLQRVIRVIRQE